MDILDILFNIYHTIVDFFLVIVYFFQKLGSSLVSLVQLAITPFTFLKDIITNLNFSNVQSLNFNFNEYFNLLNNYLGGFGLLLSLLIVVLLWIKLKKIFG
jgi:hypothetical protein